MQALGEKDWAFPRCILAAWGCIRSPNVAKYPFRGVWDICLGPLAREKWAEPTPRLQSEAASVYLISRA